MAVDVATGPTWLCRGASVRRQDWYFAPDLNRYAGSNGPLAQLPAEIPTRSTLFRDPGFPQQYLLHLGELSFGGHVRTCVLAPANSGSAGDYLLGEDYLHYTWSTSGRDGLSVPSVNLHGSESSSDQDLSDGDLSDGVRADGVGSMEASSRDERRRCATPHLNVKEPTADFVVDSSGLTFRWRRSL